MLELNIFQNKNQTSRAFGKWYARVEVKKQLSIHDMALHMAEHNTPFSVGTIEGILRDFVSCTREQCLSGNTVKIDNLAIFKCAVSANGLVLSAGRKVNAGIGQVPIGGWGADDTQYALKNVRLQATATGNFSKSELTDTATFRWTKAAKQAIEALINPTQGGGSTPDPSQGGTENGGGTNQGGGTGNITPGGGDNGGGDNGGGDDNGGGGTGFDEG
ncbi:MAG: hypothetical protein J5658_13705 [Prevotella sp.]|nr:hypothetical protein [Prevotella sp.]